MYKNTKTTRKLPSVAIVVGVLLVIAALSAGAYAYVKLTSAENPITTSEPKVNLEPATKEEKQATERYKDSLSNSDKPAATTPATPGQKKAVTVTITNASTESINAYVTGVFEEGGMCTATISNGTETVTRTSTGFGNVSTTNCAPMRPGLPGKGAWTVNVTYNSDTAEGSVQKKVEVQ